MSEVMDEECLAKRAHELELERDELKRIISEHEKIIDDLVDRWNAYFAKALKIYRTPDSHEERLHALGYTFLGLIEFADEIGITRENTFPVLDLIYALDEMPEKPRHNLASRMGGKLFPRSASSVGAAKQDIDKNGSSPALADNKGGGQTRSDLRVIFMCWASACYFYLRDKNTSKSTALKAVANGCGYGDDTVKILKIHDKASSSKDPFFKRTYAEALSTLKQMPDNTPLQNVKWALKCVLRHTPPNIVNRQFSEYEGRKKKSAAKTEAKREREKAAKKEKRAAEKVANAQAGLLRFPSTKLPVATT